MTVSIVKPISRVITEHIATGDNFLATRNTDLYNEVNFQLITGLYQWVSSLCLQVPGGSA